MLPTFNRLMGMQLEIDYFANWKYLCGLFLITLLFGLLSGIYISMFLSRFQPEDILKLRFTSGYGSKLFRRILIILQLSIFLVLFIFTSIQYKQLKYIEESGVGFNPANVLAILPPHEHDLYSCKAYKDAITDIPGIESVSEVFAGLFTAVVWMNNYTPQDNADANINFRRLAGDADFIKTFGFNILEGRDFSADLATDSGKVLINETGAAELGLIDPVGQWVTAMKGDRFEIIGVVSDFNIGSLH